MYKVYKYKNTSFKILDIKHRYKNPDKYLRWNFFAEIVNDF